MKNLLNIYEKNSIKLSKEIIQKIGLPEALILGFMMDKWADFDYDDFYYTISDLSNDITISERNCRAGIQSLINEKILIKKDFKGIPAKQYYSIDEAELSKVCKG